MRDPNLSMEGIVALALREDLGDGDHTSLATIPAEAQGKARLLIKEEGIMAGLRIAAEVFRQVDPQLELHLIKSDGDPMLPGETAFTVSGNSRSILSAERLVLNFLQRMSAIATRTRRLVSLVEGTGATILDTRKTTPVLRLMEKEAVRIGGGGNHRMGLYDMVMIKDNHVDFAGGIPQAIDAVWNYLHETGLELAIEIEVRNANELEQVLRRGGVDRIMLDNFSLPELRQAVERIGGGYETEASGGISAETIRAVAETGVDFISVGALTHQIESLDMSLKAVK
ncbi:MAG TPA: carboxylating nicotinate-nucleotide diphosphorylase [Bacteroidales bacterium]|nr:carboxylating nicotinate-nucleotide diphosphorylase [Bacteroidales bacterium]